MSHVFSDTFTTTGTLGPYVVGIDPNVGGVVYPKDTVEELLSYQFTGTWNGATAAIQLCNNLTVSPQKWTTVTSGSISSNGADVVRLPTGAAIRVLVTDTASPQGAISLYISLRGQLKESTAT